MQNDFLFESTCDQSAGSSASEKRKDTALALPCSSTPFPLIRCECHIVLSSTFACVAVSDGEVCLFCVMGKKTKSAPTPSPCCLLCNLVSLMSQTHAPSQWLVMGDLKELHAVCAKWLHDHGNMSCIQPRVLLVWPSATSPQILKNRKKEKNNNFKTILF